MPITTAVVLTLTVLLLAPLEANAGGRGGGMRFGGVRVGGHGFGHHVVFRRRNLFFARRHFRFFRDRNNFAGLWWPWGWGDYGSYGAPYTNDDYSIGYQTPPLTRAKCEHSEQTPTVLSVNGGTTEVTILRC
jgi:hypothetical protein